MVNVPNVMKIVKNVLLILIIACLVKLKVLTFYLNFLRIKAILSGNYFKSKLLKFVLKLVLFKLIHLLVNQIFFT